MSTENRRRSDPSDQQLISRLRRRSNPATAADLGVSARRLRSIDGIVQAGVVRTGKAGRPAILFTVPEKLSEASDPRLSQQRSDSDAQAARSGELSREAAIASEEE